MGGRSSATGDADYPMRLASLGVLLASASLLEAQARPHHDSLALPEVTLHYQTMGRGQPVLLLSGGPGTESAYLEPVFTHVARRAQAILLDQRGTGRSVLARTD